MPAEENNNLEVLTQKARQFRSELFEKMVALNGGHPGSTMSIIETVVALYYGGFIRRLSSDSLDDADKIIISKGHATMALYPVLTDLGYIDQQDWQNWGTDNPSNMRVFANTSIPGIDATTGSLGHGVGVGAGYALSYKKRNIDRRVFVIISEGELYEGSTWESLMFAAHHNLDNLYILIDRNDLIILGKTEDCVAIEPMDEKMTAFGFKTTTCDGHNYGELLEELERMTKHKGNPSCLIFKTTKGKGFSIMENQPHWHYWNPLSEEEIETCRREIA